MAPSTRKRALGVALRIAGLAVGALVVTLLVRSLGAAHVMGYLRRVGPGFVLALCAYAAANVLYALPLGQLLPPSLRPPLSSLVASRFAAVAVNAATPFFGVGGEPVRLLWLPPGVRSRGLPALTVDRCAFLVAGALFLGLGAALAVGELPLPPSVHALLAVAAGVALLLAGLLVWAQRAGGIARPIARLAGRFVGHARREKLLAGATDIDVEARAIHHERPLVVARAIALHLGARLVSSLELLVLARLLSLPVGVMGALLLTAAPLAVDLVLSMVPSQIGFAEGASAIVAGALGFDPAAGVALALLQRARQVVFVSLGFVLLSTRRAAARRSTRAAMELESAAVAGAAIDDARIGGAVVRVGVDDAAVEDA